MSWRLQKTHQEETKAVKAALAAEGIYPRKVGHGTGTAWGWLDIYLGDNPSGVPHQKATDTPTPWLCVGNCPACERNREIDAKVLDIAQRVTGRSGDYHGEIGIYHQ